jgi:hypothetical protein
MEIWKDVPGYIGLYKVSNYGRIKSKSHTLCRLIGKNGLPRTPPTNGLPAMLIGQPNAKRN